MTITNRFLAPLLLFAALHTHAAPPNFVIIFTDDMGYGDIGPFGASRPTPHLDRMAKEGMKFTDFYVSSSACTPSRAALMTGCYADRIGMGKSVVFPADRRGLNPSEITIAEILKKAGYATGCFGKWHLGDQPEFMPLAQGFDEYEGIPYSNDMWVKGNPRRKYPPLPWVKQNKPVAHIPDAASQSVITDAITDAAVDFIKRHKDKPFFAYVPHSAVHAPSMVTPERLEAAKGDVMTALITEIDNSTGRILQTLRELGLDKNTFVLFTNDNGGGGKTSRGPLRGAKFGPKYEGHMRVSTVARWPGKIPAGSTSSEIMTTTDIMPTIARMAGQPVPTDRIIDGRDISHLLFDRGGATSPHRSLYYENDGIRQGKWKLVRYRVKKDRFTELYDLEADLGERDNLADKHPDRVKAMKAALDAHVANLRKNIRPAAFVENPKPILAESGNLPTLSDYRGLSGKQPTSAKPKQDREANEAKPAKPSTKSGAAGKRPDILFIAIDDMNDWTTLFDDKNPIQTPNLKRLAERGAFFSRAYCAVPACNPSRTAILTGLAPTTSGVYSNGQSWKQLLPDVVTLPQYFGQHGYATKGGGKIFHHGGTGTDRKDNPSFDEFFKLRIHANKPKTNYNGYVRGGRNIGGLASPSWDWGIHEVAKQTDEFTVSYITNVMKNEKRDKPLFLAAGIFRPHLPFWAPPSTFERYPFDKMKLPPRPQGDLDDVPPTGVKMSRTESFIFDNAIKPPEDRPGSLKKMVQCYQAAADYADEMVGRLLDQLDATGRADNTIIILWSDHGYHLGDKNATVKFTLWEKANHVPFIIVAPGVTTPGTVINRPVSLIDIYPTLIDLAGLPKKDGLDGVSLVPLLNSSKVEWNRPAVMTQGRGNHAVRSDRWRYIRYADGTEELYDHNSDPWEWKNLAGDPKHAAVIAEHKKWLPKKEAELVRRKARKKNSALESGATKANTKPKAGKPARPARNRPTRIDFTPAEYKPAENDILIADFEGKDYGKWQVLGEAFGKRPSQATTLRNRAIGYLGKGFINTYLNGDKTTGELISPPFRIERKHVNFLIGGGKHLGRAGVQLRVDDKTVRAATGHSLKDTKAREIMDWHSFNVAEFIGKDAVIKIVDKTPGGWGHTVVDHIFQSDKPMPASLPAALQKAAARPPAKPVVQPSTLALGQFDSAHRTFASYSDVGYDQKLRPQFHFSSRKNWINDPNGMVYYDGEWHLYFQHCALSVNRGPKSWGHAVSRDLVHWEQLPHAIVPYDKGAIWSGTAVVDHNNSLGRQVGETRTLAAFFTTTWREGFFQAMAYSTDRGRTYTLHIRGEPVVPNQGIMKGERDPKVFWDEAHKKWKMVLILGGKERLIRIFESDNLTDWVKAGDINRKWAAECIDLFQLPVDGDKTNMKWVIADASFDYEVGEFTGNGFVTEGPTGRGDYGRGFYAAQTFNSGPDGRVVQIGWMNDRRKECPFLVEGMPFNQQMAFPTDLTLRTTPEGIRLFRWPAPEIRSLYQKTQALKNISAEAATKALANVKPELADLSIEFEPGTKGKLVLTVRGIRISYGEKIRYRRPDSEPVELRSFTFNGKSCPAPAIDGKVKLRVLVDRSSLELYANDGATVASSYEFEIPKDFSISVTADGPVKIHSLVVNELMSAWPPAHKARRP